MTGATDQPAQPHEDPVALLRAAALRVETTSCAADLIPDELPWRVDADRVLDGQGGVVAEGVDPETDGCWIAALHPGVAGPLAAWLRESAWTTERVLALAAGPAHPSRERITAAHFQNAGIRAALEFARLILPGGVTGSDATERQVRAGITAEPLGAGTGRGSADSVALERRTAARADDPDGLGVTTGGEVR